MNNQQVAFSAKRSALRRFSHWKTWFIVSLCILWAFSRIGLANGPLINPGGWALLSRLIDGLTHPVLTLPFLSIILDSTLVTIAYATAGTFFSLIIGIMGGVLSSESWWQAHGYSAQGKKSKPWLLVRGFLSIPRSIHEIVWGLLLLNILGLDPLTAILAIAFPFGAICAKVFSEIIDEQPRRPFLSLVNSGASPVQAFTYGLLPLALPNLISYAFYRFECSIRSAAVLGIIGAGGLGYQLLLSFQSLRYEELLPSLLALFFLSGITDIWSSRFRKELGGATRINILMSSSINNTSRPSFTNRFVRNSIAAMFLLVVFAFIYLKPDFLSLISPRTANLLAGMAKDMFPPRLPPNGIAEIFRLTAETLAISILAMTLVSFFSIGAAFFSSSKLNRSRLTMPYLGKVPAIKPIVTRLLLLISRAVPTPIWALMILFVVFPGILPGALALAIHNWGITGRLMAENIDNMDDRPLLALQSIGAGTTKSFLYSSLPESLPGFISYILYRWENCLRETVVIGLVGAGGLGRLLSEQISNFDYPGVFGTLLALMVLTIVVDFASVEIRKNLRARANL